MGLILRRYNVQGRHTELQNLRTTIFRAFNANGLRVAEYVQSGIILQVITLFSRVFSIQIDLSEQLEQLLKKVDEHVQFIQRSDIVEDKVERISQRINGSNPLIFILLGVSSAIEVVQSISKKVKIKIENYEQIIINDKDGDLDRCIIYFIKQTPKSQYPKAIAKKV